MATRMPKATSFGEGRVAGESRIFDEGADDAAELMELLVAFSQLDASDRETVLELARSMAEPCDEIA
jgi:hypothetical protein